MKNFIKIFIIMGAVFVLQACQTTGSKDTADKNNRDSIPEGYVELTNDEIIDYYVGNTVIWEEDGPGSGIYYLEDGTFISRWEGKRENGTWTVEDGVWCIKTSSWDTCSIVVQNDSGDVKRYSNYSSKWKSRTAQAGNVLNFN